MSLSSWCTLRWKHWAAFLSPYGIRRNLKRPSVVIMAVLSCDASSTCTCWNACRRSILLNTEHPAKRSLKAVSAGRGYLSSLVMAFRRRKSPHTRHEPSGFITACIGDAQLESHRSMTFSASHCLSCSSTCTFFSPWSFLHGVYTGGPSVVMWRGVVMVTTLPRLGSVTSGKSVHRWAYSLSSCSAFRIEPPASPGFTEGITENTEENVVSAGNVSRVTRSVRQRLNGSITKRFPSPSWKKSMPKMG